MQDNKALKELEEWLETQEYHPWDHGFRKVLKDIGLFLVGILLFCISMIFLGWVVETLRERPHLIEEGIYGYVPPPFSVGEAHAYVQTTNNRGSGHYWAQNRVTVTFRLGCENADRIEAWGPCWDDVAKHAMKEWNVAGSPFRFTTATGPSTARPSCTRADRTRVVVWGTTICGQPIAALALTSTWTYDNGAIADSDVVFDTWWKWRAYTGPMRGFSQPDLHRVAVHEFGHMLGLDHPNDHGQRVDAIMNSGADDTETLQADDQEGAQAIYGRDPNYTPPVVGFLENPGHRSFRSGIGLLSGWVCDAKTVEVRIGRQRYPMVYGTERGDTRGECGDTNNGFVTLFNFNRLDDGTHTARLLVDGMQHGDPIEFKVTTFGQEFLRGASGEYVVAFPTPGDTTILGWDQNSQNFVVQEVKDQ